jgi:hypothetical protein
MIYWSKNKIWFEKENARHMSSKFSANGFPMDFLLEPIWWLIWTPNSE